MSIVLPECHDTDGDGDCPSCISSNYVCPKKASRSGKGCWYKITIEECPVCASGREYRERQYTPKPENSADRYDYVVAYDYCDAV